MRILFIIATRTGAGLLAVHARLRRRALVGGNASALMHPVAAASIAIPGLFGPSKDRHYAL